MSSFISSLEVGRAWILPANDTFNSSSSSLRCSAATTTTASSVGANQSRGGLPRFYLESLPPSKDRSARLEGDEFWHMAKALRLKSHDRLELFNGKGGLVKGLISRIEKSGAEIVALEDPVVLPPSGVQWHIFAAFGTLKGGRADWLIEKCTELGASSVTPLVTERSTMLRENRVDRWQRVILAASKQCQRLHQLILHSPSQFDNILPKIETAKLPLLAKAEGTSIMKAMSTIETNTGGLLIIGPEGDFTVKEMNALTEAGALPVGLGPCRLRVETATIAMLAAAMLWTDTQHTRI